MSTCPTCNGDGYIIVTNPRTGEREAHTCHTCGGSGK
jgi:DnaJ-class molecular chaperone